MRTLRRWYEEVSTESVALIAGPTTTATTATDAIEDETPSNALALRETDLLDNLVANVDSDANAENQRTKRNLDADTSPKGHRHKIRRRDGKGMGNKGVGLAARRRGENILESYPTIRGRRCPVVIVVEDTEGFDPRVLDSFLRSISEFTSSVPVIVLLGLATSVSSLQGMLPAATAALLNARAFQLWAPGKMMEAVQEEVLLSPERVPAFGSDVLNTLHTRFKEHDFSLTAVRRALHLLTLTHFMAMLLISSCGRWMRTRWRMRAQSINSETELGRQMRAMIPDALSLWL
jgi:origin recognition complex subunit 3